ncbi:MAG: hypothetical protein LBO66_15280 [Deltaproteobacteria bacterium]|jgi:hypothetical protein|nr:hypothetical protein [Deltaproteobacteria bacterium]
MSSLTPPRARQKNPARPRRLIALALALLAILAAIPTARARAEAEEEADGARAAKAPALPISSWSLAHLYEIIDREPPLNNLDLDSYIKELPLILKLREDPGLIPQILADAGWSPNRLAYVCAKVGAGLTLLLNDPAAADAIKSGADKAAGAGPAREGGEESPAPPWPSFVDPSPDELSLIAEREAEIAKAFHKAIAQEKKP